VGKLCGWLRTISETEKFENEEWYSHFHHEKLNSLGLFCTMGEI
jgi:hypothetical protein